MLRLSVSGTASFMFVRSRLISLFGSLLDSIPFQRRGKDKEDGGFDCDVCGLLVSLMSAFLEFQGTNLTFYPVPEMPVVAKCSRLVMRLPTFQL
jgi:hypothetical protein